MKPRLNAYESNAIRRLYLEAKSVLDQVVNVENQLNELTFREAEVQLFKKDHPTYRALREKNKRLSGSVRA
jgi:tyrosine-protein kinase Etk/Wzc